MFKGLALLLIGIPFLIYVGIIISLFITGNKQAKEKPVEFPLRHAIGVLMLSPFIVFSVSNMFKSYNEKSLAHDKPISYPIDLPSCDIAGYDTAQYHGMTVTVTSKNKFYLSTSVPFIEDSAGTYKMLFTDKVNSYILITFNNGSQLVSRANWQSWFFDYPIPKGNNNRVKKVAFAHP